MYAKVIIEYPVKSLDQYFTYIVPNKLQDVIKVGMKVLVPFGHKLVNGFVLELTNISNLDVDLKEINSIVDSELILSSELIELGKHMQSL